MERTIEKLGKFSEMVMQDAYRKKKERVRQAEKEKQEIIASSRFNTCKRLMKDTGRSKSLKTI